MRFLRHVCRPVATLLLLGALLLLLTLPQPTTTLADAPATGLAFSSVLIVLPVVFLPTLAHLLP